MVLVVLVVMVVRSWLNRASEVKTFVGSSLLPNRLYTARVNTATNEGALRADISFIVFNFFIENLPRNDMKKTPAKKHLKSKNRIQASF